MRYSEERKEAVLAKLLPPHNRTIAELAEEEGISTATLYAWRRQARAQATSGDRLTLTPTLNGSQFSGWTCGGLAAQHLPSACQ